MLRRTAHTGTGGGLVEVVLDDGPGGGENLLAPAVAAEPPAYPPARRPRFVRPAALLGAAALVTVVVTANVAEESRDRARLAVLAANPTVFDPMPEPLRPAWEHQGRFMGSGTDLVLIGDLREMNAVDPVDGEVVWTRQGPTSRDEEEYCWPVGAHAVEPSARYEGRALGASEPPEGPDLLGCMRYSTFGFDPRPAFVPVEVDILDARTGVERHTLSVTGVNLVAEPAGTEVVIAVATAEGHVRFTRWDPASGAMVSDVSSAERVFQPGTAEVRRYDRYGDVVVLTGLAQVAFSTSTGEEVPTEDLPGTAWDREVPLDDGAVAVWSYQRDGEPARGAVLDADGAVRFDLAGPPVVASASDGSTPEVLVAASADRTKIVGLDAATGRELWSLHAPQAAALAQADGVLVVTSQPAALGVDVRTGSVLWTEETSSAVSLDGVTDGDVVVLVEEAGTPGLDLVARTIADGEERWRATLPERTSGIQTVPGSHLMVWTADSIIGLR